MIEFLSIALAGAAGAVARWLLSRVGYVILGTGFAWGTLIVNVLGCFLIGFLVHWTVVSRIPETVRNAAIIGFLGAMTTFSTFSYETVRFLEEGRVMAALANVAANIVLCLAATIGGLILSRTMFGGQP